MARSCLVTMPSMVVLLIFVGRAGTTADWHDSGGMPTHPEVHHSWQVGGFHQHHFYDHEDPGKVPPPPFPDAVPGHKIGQPLLGAVQGNPYDPYSVWINETYHVYDGSGGGGAQSAFSHGFIIEEPNPMPEYCFVPQYDNDPSDDYSLFDMNGDLFNACPYVRDAFSKWSAIDTDDPAHLVMGLGFRELSLDNEDMIPEIFVQFVDYIPGSIARWRPGSQILEFRRYDDNALTVKHKWFTGAGPAGMPDDNSANDMFTAAIHEVGHIVGLDHQNDLDDIMYGYASFGWTIHRGGAWRDFSQDDILGARDLYSIPIPEPATILLVSTGALGLFTYIRRRMK